MVAVNPIAPEVNTPDMTGRSQGIGTSHVFSTLFGGIGELAGQYAKARDEQIKNKIYDDTLAQRDEAAKPLIDAVVNGGYTAIPGTPGAAATAANSGSKAPAVDDNGKPIKNGVGQGNINLGLDPTTTGAVNLDKAPPEVKNAANTTSRLQQALDAGTISQAYYDSQLLSIYKGLRAKYPGYNKEIDSIVQSVTGKDPTNAMVGDFYEIAAKNAAATKSEENSWQSYITQAGNQGVIGIVAPDLYTNPTKYADPAARARVYALVSQYRAGVEISNRKAQLNSEKAQNDTLDKADVLQTGISWADTISRQALSTANQTYDLNKKLDQWSTPGAAPPSANDITAMEGTVNQVRGANLTAVDEWLTRGVIATPQADGSVKYSGPTHGSFLTTEQTNQIRTAATRQIDLVWDRISHKDYGMAGFYSRNNQMQLDQDVHSLRAGNIAFRATQAYQQIGGQAMVEEARTLGLWEGGYASERAKGIGQGMLIISAGGNPPSGPPNSLTDTVRDIKSGGDLTPADSEGVIVKHLNDVLALVKGTKDPAILANEVDYIFGDRNKGFLTAVVPRDQWSTVYSKMTDPAVSDAIKKAAANKPELWAKYSTWVATNFPNVLGEKAANLQQAATGVPGASFTFDPKTMALTYIGKKPEPPKGFLQGGGFMGLGQAMENANRAAMNDRAETGTRELNLALQAFRHVAELGGEDAPKQLGNALANMGLDPTAAPVDSVLGAINGAVMGAVAKVGSGLAVIANPSNMKNEPKPGSQYDNLGNAPVSPQPQPNPLRSNGVPPTPGTQTPPQSPSPQPVKPQASNASATPPVQNASAPATPRGWDPAATEAKLKAIDEKAAAAVTNHPSATDLAAVSSTTFEPPMTGGKVDPAIVAKYEGKSESKIPISIRANNMGAISIFNDDNWVTKLPGYVGKVARPAAEGGYYAKFATPEAGVHAASILLERYGKAGTDTPTEIVRKWSADPNAWAGYAKTIAQFTGAGVNDTLDLSDPHVRKLVLMAQSQYESGVGRPVYNEKVFDIGVSASENSLASSDAIASKARLDKMADAGAEMMKGQQDVRPAQGAGTQVADGTAPPPAKIKEQLDAVEKQIEWYTKIGKLAPADLLNERVKLKAAAKASNPTG